MKKYAKLLMVPVAFLGLSSFSAAADYTINADSVTLSADATADQTLTLKLKSDMSVAFNATTDAATTESRFTCKVDSTDLTKCVIKSVTLADGNSGDYEELTLDSTNLKLASVSTGNYAIVAVDDTTTVDEMTLGQYTMLATNGKLKGDKITTAGAIVGGNSASTLKYEKLGTPKNLQIDGAATKSEVTIEWDAVEGAESYNVYRSTSSSASSFTSVLKNVTDTTYTDKSLSEGKVYYYKVTAVDNDNNKKESAKQENPLSVAAKIGKVESVSIDSVDYKTIKVTAKKVAGATGYVFYRSTGNSNTYELIKTQSSNVLNDSDDIEFGTTYKYAVAAYVKSGSIYNYSTLTGNAVTDVTVPREGTAPESKATDFDTTAKTAFADAGKEGKSELQAPKISKIVAGSKANEAKLTITKVAGAEKYVLYTNGANPEEFTGTTVTIKNLTVGESNKYTVAAKRNDKEGKVSTAVSYAAKPTEPVIYTTGENKVHNVTTKVGGVEYVTKFNTAVVTIKPLTGYTNADDIELRVYKSTSKNGTYKYVASANVADPTQATSVLAEDLTTGKTYYFKTKVRVNGTYSDFSNATSYKVVMPKFITNDDVTDLIKAEASEEIGSRAIKLTIKKEAYQDGYKYYSIYRATSKNGTYKFVKAINADEGSDDIEYTDKKLTNGQKYYYIVKGKRTVSGKAVLSTASSKVAATAKLKAVEDLDAEGGDNQATISWTKLSGAKGYRIYDEDGELLATTTKTSYTLKKLDAGTYKFTVKAYTVLNGKKKFSYGAETSSVTVEDEDED